MNALPVLHEIQHHMQLDHTELTARTGVWLGAPRRPAGDTVRGAPPSEWCCPECDAPREKFLELDAAGVRDPIRALRQSFERVAVTEMAALPVYDARLAVETVGFRDVGDGLFGILVTPWFMSAALAPRGSRSAPASSERSRAGPTS